MHYYFQSQSFLIASRELLKQLGMAYFFAYQVFCTGVLFVRLYLSNLSCVSIFLYFWLFFRSFCSLLNQFNSAYSTVFCLTVPRSFPHDITYLLLPVRLIMSQCSQSCSLNIIVSSLCTIISDSFRLKVIVLLSHMASLGFINTVMSKIFIACVTVSQNKAGLSPTFTVEDITLIYPFLNHPQCI